MHIGNIEQFFLNTFLKISLAGAMVVLLTDLIFFPEDSISISIDIAIATACSTAYLIRGRFPNIAVVTFIGIVLATMIFQCLTVSANTTTSMSIILILGFVNSVILKGKTMWVIHSVIFMVMNSLFTYQFLTPRLRFTQELNDMVTVSITYSVLYFLLSYTSAILKAAYDKIYISLHQTNDTLKQKVNEIAEQHDELLKMHNDLNTINAHLEQIVNERTEKIQQQNEVLYKYSYANAHHLRGPVARLLGLVNIYNLNPKPDPDFIIDKMADQAQEIDAVVKQINIDLDTNAQIQPKGMSAFEVHQTKPVTFPKTDTYNL